MNFTNQEISDVKEIEESDRVIGEIVGDKEGPTVIVMAAQHGNEPTGYEAVCRVLNKLENQKENFRGRFIGLIGNIEALKSKKRFIDEDMNRMWETSILDKIRRMSYQEIKSVERREMKKLLEYLDPVILNKDRKHPVIFADIHSFSAESGMFILSSREEENLELLSQLGVPLIFNMEKALQGVAFKYIQAGGSMSFSFEAGEHSTINSANNASAVLLCLLASAGCIQASKIEDFSHYFDYLKQQTSSLPNKVEYEYKHIIEPGDEFEMRPDFKNFDAVKKGDWLANDCYGKILAQTDGYILMPLYQKKGKDGFFIVKDCN